MTEMLNNKGYFPFHFTKANGIYIKKLLCNNCLYYLHQQCKLRYAGRCINMKNILEYSLDFTVEYDSGGVTPLLPYLKKLTESEVIVYGGGDIGYQKLFWLRRRGIEPICVVDRKITDSGSVFFGCPLVNPKDLLNIVRNKKIIAIIATNAYSNPIERKNIDSALVNAGVSICSIYDFNIQNFYYGTWARYFAKNSRVVENFTDSLRDNESIDIMQEYIRCIMQDDFYRFNSIKTQRKYLADDVYKWNKNETIINCGMSFGDTVFHIVNSGRNFRKIYGFETNRSVYENSEYYINLLDCTDKINVSNQYISEGTLTFDDLFFGKDEISLISLDVEGAELEILKGSQKLCRDCNPVLAISLYHKKEDIIEIPKFIKTLGDYKFYVRKYEAWKATYSKDELVLYAVPSHREIKPQETGV